MTNKSPSPYLIGSLALVLSLVCFNTDVYAAPTNKVPTVTAFSVPESSPSPVPVLTFAATDSDGTVTGYLITESASKPSATAPGWSTTPPTQYATPSAGAVTLYAWAKDNKSAVSDSAADTVTIPPPPLNADTLDGLHAAAFAPAVHAHASSDITGLAAALANKADVAHSHDTVYQKKYANVIVVAKSGGDFTDPVAAVNSITDATGTNPYLVKIMPGVYDLGTASLSLMPYVDLEGSGEGVSEITGSTRNAYLVSVQDSAEMRFLSVKNIGVEGSWSGVINNFGALTHVTANASGSGDLYGVSNGAAYVDSNASMKDVQVKVSSTGPAMGVNNFGRANNVTVTVLAETGTAFVAGSGASVSSKDISNVNVSMTATGGDAFGVLVGGHVTLNNLVVSVSGSNAYGLYSNVGTVTLHNVTITTVATSGFTHGIDYGAAMTMADVTVNASTSGICRALYNRSGTTSMTNVTAIAKNGISNIGLLNTGTDQYTQIDRSTIEGATNSIYQTNTGSILIGSSKLVGSFGGNPPFGCVSSYNGSYQPLNYQCQ